MSDKTNNRRRNSAQRNAALHTLLKYQFANCQISIKDGRSPDDYVEIRLSGDNLPTIDDVEDFIWRSGVDLGRNELRVRLDVTADHRSKTTTDLEFYDLVGSASADTDEPFPSLHAPRDVKSIIAKIKAATRGKTAKPN